MKTKVSILYVFLALIMVIPISCKKKSDTSSTVVNVNNTFAKPGNTWTATDALTNHMNVSIVSNNNGVASINMVAGTTTYPYKGYVSETEIDDYIYSNGNENSPFTLIRYNAKVGDTYQYTLGGLTATRVVESINTILSIPGIGNNLSCFRVKETIPPGMIFAGPTPSYVSQVTYFINQHYGIVKAIVLPSFTNPVPDTMVLTTTNIAPLK